MTGNDVVWLADPDNVGRHHDLRLTSRILTPGEQSQLAAASDPDRLLWAFWAAKEGAFKAWSQEWPGLVLAPVRFQVEGDPLAGPGMVTLGTKSLPVSWSHGTDWVEAVVGERQEEILRFVETGTGDAGAGVRALAVRRLVDAGYPAAGVVSGRPPVYWVADIDQQTGLSLSHDGPYWAVSFRVLNRTR